MTVVAGLKYTDRDEWLRLEGNTGAVGITDYAQDQLSDIVFVEATVAVGDTIKQGDPIASVESVKAASDVYAPAGGKVVAINEDLPAAPELINKDPYGAAWLVKIELANPAELDGLMDAAAYQAHIAAK